MGYELGKILVPKLLQACHERRLVGRCLWDVCGKVNSAVRNVLLESWVQLATKEFAKH